MFQASDQTAVVLQHKFFFYNLMLSALKFNLMLRNALKNLFQCKMTLFVSDSAISIIKIFRF